MTATMEHPSINVQIWNLMIDAEREYRYFYEKADRYRRRARWINIGIFVASIAAASYLFLNLENYADLFAKAASIMLFYVIAALTAAEMFYQTSKHLGIAETVAKQCHLIASESKRLWRRLGEPEQDANLIAVANDLEFRLNIATQVELDLDDDLNRKCEEDARKVLREEFDPA